MSVALKSRVEAVAAALKDTSPADEAVLRELLASWDTLSISAPSPKKAASATDVAPDATPVKFARVEFAYLEQFMCDVLVAAGVPLNEAKIAADVLIYADKRGIDSHGIGRLKPIYIQRILSGILKPTASITIVSESDTTAVVDGNGGLGLYIGPKCMNICIEKAKKFGVAMVVTRNSSHYGAAGWYVNHAQEHGCIGITGTNARPSIAPTFGVQPMLGTNPITFGLPSDDGFPFLLDCATSVNQRGKIEKYAREGLPTPPGQVVDRQGRIRTDTEAILRDLVSGECSLAPLGGVGASMGGYKGYGYATVVELLSTALSDAQTSPHLSGVDKTTGDKIPMPLGHFFIAIDIAKFLPVDRFKKNVGIFLRELRASAKDPNGHGRIYTAGELENDAFEDRHARGGTLIPIALQNDMLKLRELYPSIREKYQKFSFEDDN